MWFILTDIIKKANNSKFNQKEKEMDIDCDILCKMNGKNVKKNAEKKIRWVNHIAVTRHCIDETKHQRMHGMCIVVFTFLR